jgi:hypothetical protein
LGIYACPGGHIQYELLLTREKTMTFKCAATGLSILLVVAMLTACGGGGGSSTPPPAEGSNNWDQMTWDQDNWAS